MKKFVVVLVTIAVLMFCEYRFIMCNLKPYYADNGYLLIEFMGNADVYYAEPIFTKGN